MATKSVIDGDFENCCFICGKHCNTETHHIFGTEACRTKSDRYGLVVHLCRSCHDYLHHHRDGYKVKDYLHQVGQKYYEAHIGDRQKFIEEFIRSYL